MLRGQAQGRDGTVEAGVAAILVRENNRISERCKEVKVLGLRYWLIC